MGSLVGRHLDDNLKKNQEFLLASQKAQFERQMHMQNMFREQMAAFQLAKSRELFKWAASFYVAYAAAAFISIKKYGRKEVAAPLLPLTFALGYLGDAAFGSKSMRIRDEAKRIVNDEIHLIEPLVPLPTIEELDEISKSSREK